MRNVMIDTLFEIGDIVILLVLWLTLGGDLAVLAFACYALTGIGLDFLRKQNVAQ